MIPTSTAIAGMRSCSRRSVVRAATRAATPTRWRMTRPITTTLKTRIAPTTVRPSPVNSRRARSNSPADINGARRRPANSPTIRIASSPRTRGDRMWSGSRPMPAARAPNRTALDRRDPRARDAEAHREHRVQLGRRIEEHRRAGRRQLPTSTSNESAPPVINPAAPPARIASRVVRAPRAANAPGIAIELNSATWPSVITPAISWRAWNTGTIPTRHR